MNSESSFLRYLEKHHGTVLVRIPEQSWFNRKCRKLQAVCAQLQQSLARHLADVEIKIVDSTPVPVLKPYRGNSSPCFPSRETDRLWLLCFAERVLLWR